MPPGNIAYSSYVSKVSIKHRQDFLGLKSKLSKAYSDCKNVSWRTAALSAANGIFKLLAKEVPIVGSVIAGAANDKPAGYSVTQATTYGQVTATYVAASSAHALKGDKVKAQKALGIAIAVNDLMAEALAAAEKELKALQLKCRQNQGKIVLSHSKISTTNIKISETIVSEDL